MFGRLQAEVSMFLIALRTSGLKATSVEAQERATKTATTLKQAMRESTQYN